jgi:rhodanese-related sulfurtransferase
MVPAPVTSLPSATGYTDLTPAQAKDLIAMEKNLVIIDVSPYYDNGHLPGAISIPLAMLDAKIPTLDKTKTYLVYCHGDQPSIAGARKLADAGFTKVYRLAGNYAAWTAAGYPVSTLPVVATGTPASMIPIATAGKYTDLTPAQAKDLIDNNPDLIIIDVSPNYAQGHLPRAVSYYIGDGSLDRAIPMLDKNGKYLVYCHVDSVAIRGAQKLVDAGFTKVYRLAGNYAAWTAAGYPVST